MKDKNRRRARRNTPKTPAARHLDIIQNHKAIKLKQLKSVRALAAATLYEVLAGQKSLNTSLPIAQENLSDQDAALLQEIVFGSCRWFYFLQSQLKPFLQKPLNAKDALTECLLIIGSYQLLFMRTPTHAAINESVGASEELKLSHHKALVNAILRRISELEKTSSPNPEYSPEDSYPDWMIEKLKHNWPKHWTEILKAGNERPPMTLRINIQAVSDREKYLSQLKDIEISAKVVSYAKQGITLDKASDVTTLPGFEEGHISVQDEAAQLCSELLELEADQRVLDACAAPGGKTCALLETQPSLSLTALDNDEMRSQRIYENLDRLGLKAEVRVADAVNLDEWWDETQFDRILLDAPCSATGVIRRHPDIKLLRHEDDIKALSELQLKMLTTLWETLRPGGILVYATCSIFPQENARIIERFLKAEATAELMTIDADWGIDTGFGRQLLPKNHEHDGFFYSKLKKS